MSTSRFTRPGKPPDSAHVAGSPQRQKADVSYEKTPNENDGDFVSKSVNPVSTDGAKLSAHDAASSTTNSSSPMPSFKYGQKKQGRTKFKESFQEKLAKHLHSSSTTSSSSVGTSTSESESPNDFSMRSTMHSEKVRFEVHLDPAQTVDLRTQVILIFEKILIGDPSRKIVCYDENDRKTYPPLAKPHHLPVDHVDLLRYIAGPKHNPKTRRLMFHMRFLTVRSIYEMKQDSQFMNWLKESKIYTSIMTLTTTENVRVGFFLGKVTHITNIPSFKEWIRKRLSKNTSECPEFQVNSEGIGRNNDLSTKSRALVVICAVSDVRNLRNLLDHHFPASSNFPFSPFQVMYTLDAKTQASIYKAHKSRQLGPNMVEISIPDFDDLDSPAKHSSTTLPVSLRDFVFDLTDGKGKNVYCDIDNSTRSEHTVMQVENAQKEFVMTAVQKWVKQNLEITINWENHHQFKSITHKLDPHSRVLAHQLSEVAESLSTICSFQLFQKHHQRKYHLKLAHLLLGMHGWI
jgi:hypothetical protein